MSKPIVAVIVSYRRGPKTQRPREYLLRFPGVASASDAARLIGRKVAWPVGTRKRRGRIQTLHGRNGLLKARFTKGLPGNALGSFVELIG